tara:strand:- start:615 stop:872 length:258 start_codon:yes stop_codon:yes gene_type:complete
MAKDMTLYAVSKGKSDKYFGEADAGQITNSRGALKLFDPVKAEAIRTGKKLDAEKEVIEQQTAKVEAIKAAGGSDASAVRKGPAK